MSNTLNQVSLQLESNLKETIENLFVVSAQIPVLGLDTGNAKVDSASVFRVAKAFALSPPSGEHTQLIVEIEDLLRMVRFICWVLAFYKEPLADEQAQDLRRLLSSIVLQTQARHSGFEALLKSFGIDRQLENQLPRVRAKTSKASLSVHHTKRTRETAVKLSPEGAEVSVKTTESVWSAQGERTERQPEKWSEK